ncbi:response regulator [Polaromonas sp.]|uniref:response regulator n=1 Tax=Polaromonas sp. TaxID=1869339 RepID=UPI0024895CD3|nr:response regulator [Polaromonas sp.]MDI1342227.1 response regulator [Polaromonas sp.]
MTLSAMHLLLVEDDIELGTETQRALADRGFTSVWVRFARDAQNQWTAPDAAPFDCVLLDLGLPDNDGMTLLHDWRQRGVRVPLIVLTARDALDARVAGLNSGADDYVIKPVAPDELASRIHAVTRRSVGQTHTQWIVGTLQIDQSRRDVRLDGKFVPLSPREFDILVELTKHAGQVVTKHHLARALSPLGEPLQFNTLEFHVHNLRRKLDTARIETLRGIGYALHP